MLDYILIASKQSTRMLHTLFGSEWFGIFYSDLPEHYVTFGSDHQKLVGNPMVAMMSPLHRAVERPFCMCQLLHFCKLLSNPAWTSNSMKHRFQQLLSVRKYYQLFIHELGTFLLQNTHWNHWANGANDPKIHPFPLSHVDFHLIHECLGDPTHQPKWQFDRCMHFCTTTQQSPHWLQWDAPNSPSKLPLPLRWQPPPFNTPIPQLTQLTTPNDIRIQSGVLPQYTLRTDRQTDWPTDRRSRRMFCNMSAPLAMLIECDALTIHLLWISTVKTLVEVIRDWSCSLSQLCVNDVYDFNSVICYLAVSVLHVQICNK